MKIKNPEWEQITNNTARLKVFGGWMVETQSLITTAEEVVFVSTSSIFVPDPTYQWVIEKE